MHSCSKPPTNSSMKPCGSFDRSVIALAGTAVMPCLSGGAYVADYRTLIVSDLHLEKGSSFARRGEHLPPYDTRAGLALVQAALNKWRPEQVVFLGDAFHDIGGPQRLDESDLTRLGHLSRGAELVWISGNHDPALDDLVPGRRADQLCLGPLTLRHEPQTGAYGEIAGHLHPSASLRRKGRRMRCKCFAYSRDRLIMPAFGTFTGNLDVGHHAFRPYLSGLAFNVVMIGRNGLHMLPGSAVTGSGR